MSLPEILEALKPVKVQTKVVSCPITPIEIPGITAGNTFTANDAFGTLMELEVPVSGVIYSATLFDLDDEALQIDLEIFKHTITQVTSEDPWTCSDLDILKFVTELAFSSFDDHNGSQTSELTNIGKAYSAPEGKFYIQAIARGGSDIAAGHMPRFQLQILSDNPNWLER